MNNILKVYNYYKKNGFKNTAAKVYESKVYKDAGRKYIEDNRPSVEELISQKKRRFIRGVRFSVIVPLYNSDPEFLEDMIKSVIDQSYEKWELIMIDGSPLSYMLSEEAAMKYVNADKRVKYRRLGANLGISGNTNYGVSSSIGEYVVFLDHDDVLMPEALYYAALAIESDGADFLYSDEMNFSGSIENVCAVTLKPDFSEYTLRGINYIGHMCVVKRSLFDEVGGFRKDFDGSQDYDLVLRLSEKAEKIWHLPYVLYGWRIHEGSVAGGIEAKEYCLDAAKRAIKSHVEGLGESCQVYDINGAESAYRIKYNDFDRKIRVGIVICFKGSERRYDKYVNDILDLVIENNVEIVTVGGYNIIEEVKNIDYTEKYSFTEMANIGARNLDTPYIMFLDYHYMPKGGFLEELMPYCGFEDVGCIGGRLVSYTGRIEAAGYVLDEERGLKPYMKGIPSNALGYLRRLKIVNNVSCLSGGFLMVRRKDFIAVGGFDERMGVISGGADLCLRLSGRGNIVLNPRAEAVVSGRIDDDFSEFYDCHSDKIEQGDRYIREI